MWRRSSTVSAGIAKMESSSGVEPQGKRIVLGGPRRLSPLPKPLPMRRVVLWSVLLAGVLVVAGEQ
jgi:hypothetical protein